MTTALQAMLPRVLRRSLLGIALLVVASPVGVRASVEEAHSFAMEAAAPHVKQGFNIRSDSWSGTLADGKNKIVRHQLFRGNEYWFWIGTSKPRTGLTLKIYDRKGRPVHVEAISGKYWAAARVLPPKTGSYLVVISAGKKGAGGVDWSMSYGYR